MSCIYCGSEDHNSQACPTRDDVITVTIPLRTAELIRRGYLPLNPNKCRNADPEVVEALKLFDQAIVAAGGSLRGKLT